MTHRRLVAIAAVIYGVVMLARPQDWATALFMVPFGLAPRWFWGVSFVAAGIAKIVWPSPWSAYFLGSVIGAWVLCLIWSVVSGYIWHGHPVTSPAGWVWPTVACLTLFLPDARRTHGGG